MAHQARDSFWSQVHRIRALDHGPARESASERLVRYAEDEGLEDLRAFALVMQIEAYQAGVDRSRSFVPFAALARWWDERPEMFDDTDRTYLALMYAKVVSDMRDYPSVPVWQIDQAVEQMAQHVHLAQAPDQLLLLETFRNLREFGRPGMEEAFQAYLTRADQGDKMVCQMCEARIRADHLAGTGRAEQGARVLEQVLAEGGGTCEWDPHVTITRLASIYLQQSRAEDALRAHRRAMAAQSRHLTDQVACRGPHLLLLAQVGDAEAAIRGVQTEREMFTTTRSPAARLAFLADAAGAMRLLTTEHGDRELAMGEVPASTVVELATWAHDEAVALAALFDRRNGTDARSARVARAWTSEPLPTDLRILPVAGAVVPAGAGPDGAGSEAGEAGEAGPGSGRGTEPGGVDQAGQAGRRDVGDPAGQIDELWARAEGLSDRGEHVAAAQQYAQVATVAELAGLVERAGWAWAEAARSVQVVGDEAGAAQAYADAMSRLRAGGADPVPATAVLVAWAPSAVAVGGLSALTRAAQWLSGELRGRTAVDGPAGAGAGPADDTGAAGRGRAVPDPTATDGAGPDGAEATEDPDRRRARADLADTWARVLAETGTDPERAVALAREAAEEYAGVEATAAAAHAFWLAGRLHQDHGAMDDAVRDLESAAEGFAMAGRRPERTEVVAQLTALLRAEGRTQEAEQAEDRLRAS